MHTTLDKDDTEKKSATRRIGTYAVTALGILAAAGAVITLAVLPGLAIVVNEFTRQSRGRYYRPSSMRIALYRLRSKGLIRVVPRGKELRLTITQKGLRLLRKIRKRPLIINRPPKWDRQWRLVAFDIPELLKTRRETFRNTLTELGFRKLQKSLFVIPYPCEKEVSEITEELGIGPYVHLITAISFNAEPETRRLFNLS